MAIGFVLERPLSLKWTLDGDVCFPRFDKVKKECIGIKRDK